MPHSPLPESPDDDASDDPWISMRWINENGQFKLLEIVIGGEWGSTDLGRHIRHGVFDVVIEAGALVEDVCDDIIENEQPAPSGTPVVLGRGQQVLRTCELGGALFSE